MFYTASGQVQGWPVLQDRGGKNQAFAISSTWRHHGINQHHHALKLIPGEILDDRDCYIFFKTNSCKNCQNASSCRGTILLTQWHYAQTLKTEIRRSLVLCPPPSRNPAGKLLELSVVTAHLSTHLPLFHLTQLPT